jgi:plasmid stabilization system protein ParE
MNYQVSRAAREDLDEIWFYIAQDDPVAADGFIEFVVSHFQKLAGCQE